MRRSFCAAMMIAAVCSCAVPQRDYDVQTIAQVTDLKELMHVQATVADPRFKLANSLQGKAPSESQFLEFADMGVRLQAAAKRLSEISKEPGFEKHTRALLDQSTVLERAARGQDGPKTLSTAIAIKQTCAACHREFR